MASVRWARLLGVAGCGLRRGAWYPVAVVSATEVQVHVRGRVARVPRALLELRDRPPSEWTVVPAGARDAYMVCPNCRARQPLPKVRVAVARCPRCNEAFAVVWKAAGDVARSPAVDTLRRDRRMTRRRRDMDRRAAAERRAATRRRAVVVVPVDRRRVARRGLGERRAEARRSRAGDRRKRATVW